MERLVDRAGYSALRSVSLDNQWRLRDFSPPRATVAPARLAHESEEPTIGDVRIGGQAGISNERRIAGRASETLSRSLPRT